MVVSCKALQPIVKTSGEQNKIEGESFVLAAERPSNFLYSSIVKGSVTVRNTYLPFDSGAIIYAEDEDYTIDYNNGTIARTAGSRIPDYAKYNLFEKKDFDHNNFPNYSNNPYFIWVDYASIQKSIFTNNTLQENQLPKFTGKLEKGEPVLVLSYGNSIAAGSEASSHRFRFQNRWVQYLQNLYPAAKIDLQDASIPGYTSLEAIAYWETYIGKKNPDLVLLGWGMNEANVGAMTPSAYKSNLIKLVQMSREQKNAEVIIFSCFRPNDNWHYSSHSMELYTQAAKEAAAISGCAFVDVYDIFEKVFARKDQPSLLANNINHPNNFGHWLYFQAFKSLKF
jgi:hypothetical protein